MTARRAPQAAAPAEDVDGRTARRDRNRVAVLDAVLELFSEGNLTPSPDDVARRSGVSLRSVYRYVADADDLARAAIQRHLERVEHLFAIHAIGQGPLDERIERFVEARVRLYETIAATYRAARLRAPANPIIQARVEEGRRQQREQVDVHFAPELRRLPAAQRRAIATAVDALSQLETIDLYRVHQGLTVRTTEDVMRRALHQLLTSRVTKP